MGRIVTISTRVKKHGDLLAIAERFPDVYCSVGTHPHNAHEELDITTADLVARTRHPKVVAIGEAGLDYHYDYSPRDAQERGFRNHIAAARETGLPLVIHSREADDDMARILEEETGKGAFPAVLHCYTGGPELAAAPSRSGCRSRSPASSPSRNPTTCAPSRRRCRRTVSWSKPTRRISRPASIAASATSRPMWWRPPKCWRKSAACQLRRARAADHRQFLPAVQQGAAARRRSPDKFRQAAHVSARPHDAAGLPFSAAAHPAACRGRRSAGASAIPNNPKNRRRRTSFLVERRTADGVTRVLVDTSPDLREQLLDANVDWLDAVLYTHEHADHTHGIDDLRGLFINRRKRVPVWLDERVSQIMHARFGYCFAAAPGSEYPPMVREHRMEAVQAGHGRGAGRHRSPPCPSSSSMATSPRSASASARLAYSCDLSGLPPDSVAALAGLDVWIVDALRDKPHPSHLSVVRGAGLDRAASSPSARS